MAEIGDKVFTTELMSLVKEAVRNELGSNAFVNRYLAEVTAVDTTTSAVTVKLSGSDTASANFRVRGLQMPSLGDQVIACIDGEDRWIDSVVRPVTSTPFLQISSGSIVGAGLPTGSIVPYVGTAAPSGWLLCNGALVSRTTYAALFTVLGTKAGAGDGSTTFALPNLQDRFLAGNAATATGYAQNAGTFTPNAAAANHSHTSNGSVANYSATAITSSGTVAAGTVAIGGGVTALPTTNSGQPSVLSGGQLFQTSTSGSGHRHDISHDHGDTFSATFTGTSHTHTTDIDHGHTFTTAATSSDSGAPTPKSGLVNFIIKT